MGLSLGILPGVSTWLITSNSSVITWLRGVFSRFLLFLRSESLGPAYTQELGIKLPLLEGRLSNNLWTHGKTTIVIDKIFKGRYFEAMQIFCFFLKFCVNQWILPQKLLLWSSNGDILFPSFLPHLLIGIFCEEDLSLLTNV